MTKNFCRSQTSLYNIQTIPKSSFAQHKGTVMRLFKEIFKNKDGNIYFFNLRASHSIPVTSEQRHIIISLNQTVD